jgi:elongator complex protein 3
MKRRGLKCQCIRCREVGQTGNRKVEGSDAWLHVREYEASYGGTEFFLSFENELFIFGFCRLRIPPASDVTGASIFPELKNAAMVRELHVYGELVPRSTKRSNDRQVQHAGYGRKLLQVAEDLVRDRFVHCTKLCVISGVGVREFYEKVGWYRQEGNGYFLARTIDRNSESPNVSILERQRRLVAGAGFLYAVVVAMELFRK